MVERTVEPGASATGVAAPSEPREWYEAKPEQPVPFWSSLRDDIIAHVPAEQQARSRLGWALATAKISLTSPGFKVALAYRFNHAVVNRAGVTGKVLAGAIGRVTHFVYGSSIAPKARIYGGVILPHPQGIIIGSRVVIGPRTWIFHNVTMGGTSGKDGEPTVGADCRIYANAVIGGPIKVGDNVVVSPNSLVQRSVPSGSTAVGVPANVFPKFSKPKA